MKCPDCHGHRTCVTSAMIRQAQWDADGDEYEHPHPAECQLCQGSGEVDDEYKSIVEIAPAWTALFPEVVKEWDMQYDAHVSTYRIHNDNERKWHRRWHGH